jgi:DNA gyrase/topoisomerase IV subunit A
VPNILVSGSTGIAVGMATNIPTHNLGEVIDATVAYLNDPEIQLEDLLAGHIVERAGRLVAEVESSMQHLRSCIMCMPQDLARSRCAVR